MILPILDYCGAVSHGCVKENEEGLKCLQGRGARVVYCPFVQRAEGYKFLLEHSYKKERKLHC